VIGWKGSQRPLPNAGTASTPAVMQRRKQVTIGRNAAGAGAAAREQRLRKFYVVASTGGGRLFVGTAVWRSNLGRHSPHLPLLDLISRTPAANLVPRRSGSGRTRSAARSAKHSPDPISIGATAIRNSRSPVLASLSTSKADLLVPAHDHRRYEAGFVDEVLVFVVMALGGEKVLMVASGGPTLAHTPSTGSTRLQALARPMNKRSFAVVFRLFAVLSRE
jgi:hypothetical protein